MVKLTIKGKPYFLPERLTVDQWKRLLPFDYQSVEAWPHIMGTLLETDHNEFKQATIESLTLAVSFVIALMNARVEGQIKDFTKMTFGEFVDLDIAVSAGIEKHVDLMTEILTGLTTDEIIWSDQALWAIDQFQRFRVHTYRQYSGLFGLNEPQFDEDEDETPDPNKIAKGWYRIIVDLAHNDVLKLDEVTDQPLKKILNFMALKKEKQIEENFKQLEQKRKYDLSRNRK